MSCSKNKWAKTCQEEQQEIEIGFSQHITDRETFDEIIELSYECNYDWENLVYFSRLKEDWIREGKFFMNYIAWSRIIKYQEVSKDFIREFKDQLLPISAIGASILEARYGRKFLEEIIGKDFN